MELIGKIIFLVLVLLILILLIVRFFKTDIEQFTAERPKFDYDKNCPGDLDEFKQELYYDTDKVQWARCYNRSFVNSTEISHPWVIEWDGKPVKNNQTCCRFTNDNPNIYKTNPLEYKSKTVPPKILNRIRIIEDPHKMLRSEVEYDTRCPSDFQPGGLLPQDLTKLNWARCTNNRFVRVDDTSPGYSIIWDGNKSKIINGVAKSCCAYINPSDEKNYVDNPRRLTEGRITRDALQSISVFQDPEAKIAEIKKDISDQKLALKENVGKRLKTQSAVSAATVANPFL